MNNPIADVLIVGADPVGLTAAVVLEQLGHDVTIVDRQAEGADTSGAAVVHPHTWKYWRATAWSRPWRSAACTPRPSRSATGIGC
ncbi:FAD-dependent oxidoreductase [Nocardia asiatica]|uniref:FAD-dependent oxidoreductase n=1 Tax=Nocardia asiatica TaxID=209252 RepID=UPI002457E787|nr:FAD-dependent oxidoreductase [Nocardia asiatica]